METLPVKKLYILACGLILILALILGAIRFFPGADHYRRAKNEPVRREGASPASEIEFELGLRNLELKKMQIQELNERSEKTIPIEEAMDEMVRKSK